tara:strand:+ start:4232 stop:5386 length:1155 start_codon:yes stop_codon:yes gene_type:complete
MGTKWNVFTNNFDLVNSVDTLVVGPAVSTDNAIARFDGTTGKVIQNSGSTLSDADVLSTGELNVTTDVAVQYGGTGRSDATEYAVICGGTTTTGAHQSIASVGTAAQVLTSNGPGILPTFQAAGGGSSPTTTRGDIIRRGASADERLALGNFGHPIGSDNTDVVYLSPRNLYHFLDDFTDDSGISYILSSGGGAVAPSTTVSGTSGVVLLRTTSAINSLWSIQNANTATGTLSLYLGGGEIRYETKFKTSASSQTATDYWSLRLGLVKDSRDGPGTDGVYFEHNYNNNTSNNWFAVERASSSDTSTDTGVAADGGVYQTMTIVINSGATSAAFYIDDSLVHTETISFSGTTFTWSIESKRLANDVVGNVDSFVDYLEINQLITR